MGSVREDLVIADNTPGEALGNNTVDEECCVYTIVTVESVECFILYQ
jgi:hypothetical protein